MKANQVTSIKTQLPYDYYDLPFCKRKHTRAKADNWGESITGDTATNSPYVVSSYYYFIYFSSFISY